MILNQHRYFSLTCLTIKNKIKILSEFKHSYKYKNYNVILKKASL